MLKDIGIKKFFLYTFSAIGGVSLLSGLFLVIFIKVNVGGLTVKTADNAQKQELLLEQNIHLSSIHGAISTLLTEKDMDKLEKIVGVVNSDLVELEKHYKECGVDCEKLFSEFLIYKSKADELINKNILMGKNAEAIEFFIQEQSKIFESMLKSADALSKKNHTDVENFLTSFKSKTLSIILVTIFSSLFLQLAVIYAIRSSRKMIQVLSVKIAELSGKGHDVDASAAKLSHVSGDLAATVHEQAAAIQESVAAMEEMSSMLHQTNEMTKSACELSEHIKNHADEGKNTISNLMKSMEDIHTSSQELKQINQIIEDIQSKTQIINDIVFKTQLLSFNASIEAARAGQHGKGFAVVAEEIGKLAQISGEASHTITTLLESSKSSVMHIVGQTQESAEHGKTISQDVQVIFNTIDENILEINQMFQKVFEASREQELGIEQTNTALAQVEEGTKVNLQNADSSAQNAHNLNEISKDMVHINDYLNELIDGAPKNKTA